MDLRKNPFLRAETPKLTLPNPFLAATIRPNPVKRRRNPFVLPAGIVGKTSANLFGAGAAIAVNAVISRAIDPLWMPGLQRGLRWGCALSSPWISSYFPRLGPAYGGAMYYSVLNPLVETHITRGILASVAEAVGT